MARAPRRETKQTGHRGETFGEYFDFARFPEKITRKVTRAELLFCLDHHYRLVKYDTFWSRLWRWLKAPRGSGAVHRVEPSKVEDQAYHEGEMARSRAARDEAGHLDGINEAAQHKGERFRDGKWEKKGE